MENTWIEEAMTRFKVIFKYFSKGTEYNYEIFPSGCLYSGPKIKPE
jgi:hypothetical protein